jgi:predicted metal-dependent peptidase
VFGKPGIKKNKINKLNVILDTSSSVSEEMIERFFTEIDKMTMYFKINLLQWDSSFRGYEIYKKNDWKNLEIKGGGGTDMSAPFTWLERNNKITDVNVIFTDGICDWPDQKKYSIIPVICGDSLGPPWAKPIRISI